MKISYPLWRWLYAGWIKKTVGMTNPLRFNRHSVNKQCHQLLSVSVLRMYARAYKRKIDTAINRCHFTENVLVRKMFSVLSSTKSVDQFTHIIRVVPLIKMAEKRTSITMKWRQLKRDRDVKGSVQLWNINWNKCCWINRVVKSFGIGWKRKKFVNRPCIILFKVQLNTSTVNKNCSHVDDYHPDDKDDRSRNIIRIRGFPWDASCILYEYRLYEFHQRYLYTWDFIFRFGRRNFHLK